jgi:hypothetical protein
MSFKYNLVLNIWSSEFMYGNKVEENNRKQLFKE